MEEKDIEILPPAVGTFYGHVVELDKHRLKVLFKDVAGNVFQLQVKRKKLNDIQKQFIKVDVPARIDFNEKKLAFMGGDAKWY